jgi:flagellar basal-body rod modification protein FlgD
MTNWVNVTNAPSTVNKDSKTTTSKSTLGKDDFLKILTTQLSNQDPSSPLSDKDFIAQMATFSSLEQMTNLNETFKSFADLQLEGTFTFSDMFEKFSNLQMGQYASTIGKEITWTPAGSTVSQTGIVTGVSKDNGNYFYMVGDQKVSMENVTKIQENQQI